MVPTAIDALLAETLDDARLSRKERQALAHVVETITTDADRASIRHRAFDLARSALADPADGAVLDWLEDVVKTLDRGAETGRDAPPSEAYFSPGDPCPRRIVQLLAEAGRTIDVCVFTITDDRLSDAILDAHRRGVAVRIITDDDKVLDEGSDVERFRAAGIPVRVDHSEYHMHHKFALFDGSILLTGSYNWTRGASTYNQDNFLVTADPRLLSAFIDTFTRLWHRLESHQ